MLHLAPHPDDELLGAPAALMALRDRGWRVLNVACGLGRDRPPGRRSAREAELREACRRAGFELEVADDSDGEEGLVAQVDSVISAESPSIVVAPSPHDAHPRHEAVGRVVVEACESSPDGVPVRIWLWGLWADLPFPTLAVPFGEERLEEIISCLEAHTGELHRNDYRRLLRGRAEMSASLGPERVFGFGTRASADGRRADYVELLCEVGLSGGSWKLGAARWLDPDEPTGGGANDSPAPLTQVSVGDWLRSPSPSASYRATAYSWDRG